MSTRQQDLAPEDHATGVSGLGEAGRRKPYREPRLTEWGSIVEITRGLLSGLDDPVEQGTELE